MNTGQGSITGGQSVCVDGTGMDQDACQQQFSGSGAQINGEINRKGNLGYNGAVNLGRTLKDGTGKDTGSHGGTDEVSRNVDARDSEFRMEISNQ